MSGSYANISRTYIVINQFNSLILLREAQFFHQCGRFRVPAPESSVEDGRIFGITLRENICPE